MKVTFLGVVAVACGGLLLGSSARAETKLLAGVGSLSDSRDISAPVITLQANPATIADTIEVNGPIARGVARVGWAGGRVVVGAGRVVAGTARFAAGYPFRPWGGYYRPWGLYRPWYGYYRPWGWYRPWYAWGPRAYWGGGYVAAYPSYLSYSPAVIYGSPCAPAYAYPPPPLVETAPPPVPNDNVPAPRAPRPVAPRTPPAQSPPVVDTIALHPVKKLEYPAYGEAPRKARNVGDPLLAKDAR